MSRFINEDSAKWDREDYLQALEEVHRGAAQLDVSKASKAEFKFHAKSSHSYYFSRHLNDLRRQLQYYRQRLRRRNPVNPCHYIRLREIASKLRHKTRYDISMEKIGPDSQAGYWIEFYCSQMKGSVKTFTVHASRTWLDHLKADRVVILTKGGGQSWHVMHSHLRCSRADVPVWSVAGSSRNGDFKRKYLGQANDGKTFLDNTQKGAAKQVNDYQVRQVLQAIA